MEYLRRFNEDKEIFDYDYVQSCFIEFYDDMDRYDVFTETEVEDTYLRIAIDLPKIGPLDKLKNYYTNSFEEFIEHSKQVLDFYEEVNVSVNKVKIKYPDLEIEYEYGDDEKFIRISFIK